MVQIIRLVRSRQKIYDKRPEGHYLTIITRESNGQYSIYLISSGGKLTSRSTVP